MSGYTPGTWVIGTLTQNDGSRAIMGDDDRIARVDDYEGVGKANARLIAAAPELLEALEEILGPLATIAMGDAGPPNEQVPQEPNLRVSEAAIRRARAAIAKATGEAS